MTNAKTKTTHFLDRQGDMLEELHILSSWTEGKRKMAAFQKGGRTAGQGQTLKDSRANLCRL